MQQQTIAMMSSLSAANDINNNQLQHSTGTQLMTSMKQETLEGHHNHQNHHHHQQQQQQQQQQQPQQHLQLQPQQQFNHQNHLQYQSQQQPTHQQHQPPPQQNGPKPRGRRKKIRTEPIRPVCPQCEKQFSNQSALTKHKLTHSDERKFACQQCSKSFKRHDHLTGHMQTHSNRKPFNCTIQGCDKTYCDARSLRRHKENIHHIITQTQEPSHLLRRRIQRLHSDSGAYNRSVEHHQLNCVTAPPHSLPPQTSLTPQQVTTTTTTTPTPTPNGDSNSSGSSNHLTYLGHHGHAGPHGSFSADYASTQHFSFDFVPVNGATDINGQFAGSHQHPMTNHHHHHHHQGQHLDHQASSLNQGLDTRGVPHSAGSITDSGLGLNVHYEQHTPQPQPQPPPPPPSTGLYQQPHHHHHPQPMHPQQHVSYSAGYATTQHFDFDHLTGNMQTHSNGKPYNCTTQGCDKTFSDVESLRNHKETVHHTINQAQEPSHLLKRRIQRLHSDDGSYNRSVEHHQLNCVTAPPHSLPSQQVTTTTTTPTSNGNSNNSSNNNHLTYLNHPGHAGPHGSFSADYASTQHFSFDFVPTNGNADVGGSQFINQHHPVTDHHQGSHLNHQNSGLDQGLATRGIPHSADSITDSGLDLNAHYEQLTPQPQPPPPPPPARLYHQQTAQNHHQSQQQQQHVSYSAGYATTQHFDFWPAEL